jgi:hypothetical protein
MLLPKLHAFDTVPPVPYSIDTSPEKYETYENNNENMNTEERDLINDDYNSKEPEIKARSIYIYYFFLFVHMLLI